MKNIMEKLKHSTFPLAFILLAKSLKLNEQGNIQSNQTTFCPKHVTSDSMVTVNSSFENKAGWELGKVIGVI